MDRVLDSLLAVAPIMLSSLTLDNPSGSKVNSRCATNVQREMRTMSSKAFPCFMALYAQDSEGSSG